MSSSWFTRAGGGNASYGDVNVYLVPDEQRPFTQEEFTRVWREEIGDLPEAKSLFFEYLIGPGGNQGLRINLSHTSTPTLETAARELARTARAVQRRWSMSATGLPRASARSVFR